jgi:hypothetical protein
MTGEAVAVPPRAAPAGIMPSAVKVTEIQNRLRVFGVRLGSSGLRPDRRRLFTTPWAFLEPFPRATSVQRESPAPLERLAKRKSSAAGRLRGHDADVPRVEAKKGESDETV